MSFESAIMIVLAALAVMLAALTIIVGIAAYWGYTGMKDTVKEVANKRVDEAMVAKMKEYPASKDVLEVFQQMKQRIDLLDKLQNQVVTSPPEPKVVETASNNATVVDEEIAKPAVYPGEEATNASDGEHNDADTDAGTNNRETPG